MKKSVILDKNFTFEIIKDTPYTIFINPHGCDIIKVISTYLNEPLDEDYMILCLRHLHTTSNYSPCDGGKTIQEWIIEPCHRNLTFYSNIEELLGEYFIDVL